MDRFYIIPNNAKDPELTFSNRIIAYLEKHGARCHVQKITEKMEGPYHYTDPDGIPQDTQCIIVLGGDGTLLQAARDVVHLDIPLLGINLGTLGFLAEVDKNSVYPALDRLLSDDYELEDRMMLEGKIYRGEELIGKDIALNDIVIGREGHLRVIRFKNYVNDAYMNSYNADGILSLIHIFLKYRLENEYNVDIRLETLPYEHIRWIANKETVKVDKIVGTSDMKKVTDLKGNPLLLFVNAWSVGMVEDSNPDLVLTEFSK